MESTSKKGGFSRQSESYIGLHLLPISFLARKVETRRLRRLATFGNNCPSEWLVTPCFGEA
jgi:hypothetical protein